MLLRSLVLFLTLFAAVAAADLPPDHAQRMERGLQTFSKHIKPLLAEQCLECHGGAKTKSEFDLATREGLLAGGAEGKAIVPFKASESRLLKLVRHEEEPHMPEKKPKLSNESIAHLVDWINDGAPYETPLVDGKVAAKKGEVTEADRQWWAFQPLARVTPPAGRGEHPVDRFIAAKAAEKKLSLAPSAEKRVLIRRLYLDVLGIPPTPKEIDGFLKDRSADAWARLVDRALDSPHYGERWARHWLDVARFAESSGFEHDYDREGAYQYRDFVIRALNADMPYDQFLRWQIAGDEFAPENPQALAATGFLGAGVFPTQITANEVERTRYDAMDDMLSTTSLAFLGLTVGCARCHDHKFDPIPAADYYRMLATFTTTARSVIELDIDPEKSAALKRKWAEEGAPLQADIALHEESLKEQFAKWLADGARQEPALWTVLDLTNRVSKAGATFKKMEDGSWLVEGKNGDHDQYTFKASLPFSKVTGLKLEALGDPSMPKGGPGRADNGNIGLSRVRVFAGTNEIKISKAVATFEQNQSNLSIASTLDEKPETGWAVDPQFGKDQAAVFAFAAPVDAGEVTVELRFNLNTRHNIGRPRFSVIAGVEPALDGDAAPPAITQLLSRSKSDDFAAKLDPAERAALFDFWKRRDEGWRARMAKIEGHEKKKPSGLSKTLVCAEGYKPLRMHTQGGDFFNETYYLKRGNTDLKDGVASPDFLQVLKRDAGRARWEVKPPEGAKFSGRRAAMARWMTDLEAGGGPLVARVAVNRLWQHHFGQGIVATPNDFGRTGAAPTHPELLDWLAAELVKGGWKMKPLHKLLLTSATFQQTTAPDSAREMADPDNKLCVRRVPRRLEGEALRDSMLAVSGKLDRAMFGPGTMDERSVRRSIYFTMKRSQLVNSLVVFDLPEPLVSQGARPVTTVAPQALLIMNGPQVREWAAAFANRLAGEKTTEAKASRAFEIALGRKATRDEQKQALAFFAQHENPSEALVDFCQVIFGLNEFAYEN